MENPRRQFCRQCGDRVCSGGTVAEAKRSVPEVPRHETSKAHADFGWDRLPPFFGAKNGNSQLLEMSLFQQTC